MGCVLCCVLQVELCAPRNHLPYLILSHNIPRSNFTFDEFVSLNLQLLSLNRRLGGFTLVRHALRPCSSPWALRRRLRGNARQLVTSTQRVTHPVRRGLNSYQGRSCLHLHRNLKTMAGTAVKVRCFPLVIMTQQSS